MLLDDHLRQVHQTSLTQDRTGPLIAGQCQQHLHITRPRKTALRGQCHDTLEHLPATSRPRQSAEQQIVAFPFDPHHRRMQIPGLKRSLRQQVPAVAMAAARQQDVLRLDVDPPQHPRLVLGQAQNVGDVPREEAHDSGRSDCRIGPDGQ